jgi:hypothetical protein
VPGGAPRIRVEIFVNADGVVELSASESHSGQEKKLSTTFSYLDADERRKREGLRGSRSRRRRRAMTGAPIAAPSTAPRVRSGWHLPPPRSGHRTGPELQYRPGQSPTLPFSPTPAIRWPRCPARVPGKRGRPYRRSDGATQRIRPRSTAQRTPRESSRPARTPAKPPAPAGPVSGEAARQLDPIARTAADSQVLRMEEAENPVEAPVASGPLEIAVELPEKFGKLLEMIGQDRSDAEAAPSTPATARSSWGTARSSRGNPRSRSSGPSILILSKQPEDARQVIADMCATWPDQRKHYLGLLGLLCRNYPNYVAARRDRALLARDLGDLKIAMQDLEFIAKREDSDTNVFNELSRVYSQVLEENKDSTVQFKLVKVHLRRGELDEAIVLLQQLVQIAGFRDRADKILGLCFWQKGLRYLALQKFKSLPLNDEIKDILYRLSKEMEENDELLHAKYALERIYEEDIGYRDTAERLRKISYRVDLMKDERYGDPGTGGVDMNAETIRESLIGDRFELQGEINRGSMGIVYRPWTAASTRSSRSRSSTTS